MTHENAEDLTANVLVGRSVRHRSTIRFARHRCYGRTATVDKIAQPRSNLAFAACPLLGATRTWSRHHFGASHHASRVLPERLSPHRTHIQICVRSSAVQSELRGQATSVHGTKGSAGGRRQTPLRSRQSQCRAWHAPVTRREGTRSTIKLQIHVRVPRGKSGHRAVAAECLLLTQSGHRVRNGLPRCDQKIGPTRLRTYRFRRKRLPKA